MKMEKIQMKNTNDISKRSISYMKLKRNTISQDHNQIVFEKDKRSQDLKSRIKNLKLLKQVPIKKQQIQSKKIVKSLSEAFLPNIQKNYQQSENSRNFLFSKQKKQIKTKSNLIQKFKLSILAKQEGNNKKNTTPNIGNKLVINRLDQNHGHQNTIIQSQKINQSSQNEKIHQMYKQTTSQKKIQSDKLFRLSKSKGKLKRIYSKISNDYNRDQKLWYYHLQQQLSLEEAIQELQKIQLNRNLQPSRKLTMRQAYQLKKEIVYQIEKEESSNLIKSNIQKLAQIALDEKERDKFLMIGLFITLRQKLRNASEQKSLHSRTNKVQNQPQFIFSNLVSKELKQQVQTWKPYKMLQPNIINAKILSILVLHIMKLQSPIFSHQDINLIFKTIELKIKVQTMIDYLPDEHKNQHFEALIFMIFQSYKILYYLKLDEDMKIHQYNLLQAYLSLYKQQNPSKYQLFQQNYGIFSKISTLKPSAIGIYPYLDSRARNQINSQVLQKQIDNQSKNKNNVKGNKNLKVSTQNKSFLKTGKLQNYNNNNQINQSQYSNSWSSVSSNNQKSSFSIEQKVQNKNDLKVGSNKGFLEKVSKKQLINTEKMNAKTEVKRLMNKNTEKNLKLSMTKKSQRKLFHEDLKITQQNLSVINNSFKMDSFSFQFLLLKQEQIYIGQFRINTLSSLSKTVNLSIKVQDPQGLYPVNYKFEGIKTFTQQLNRQNFQKIIWKIFRKIFVMKYMEEQNPFLIKQHNTDLDHVQKHLPSEMSQYQFRIIQIVHQYIVYWLKKREFIYSFNGKILLRPSFQLSDVNKYMENLQYEHDRKLFQKRQGYIDPSSGRNHLILPSNLQNQLIFNPILNDFIISSQNSTQSKKQLYIFLLIKMTQCDRLEFKFIKFLFHYHLREMSIFEIGFFKHQQTQSINQKVKQIRKLKIYDNQSKAKLIQNISKIFSIQKNSIPKKLFNKDMNQINFLLDNHKKYRIEQQFQIDLSNQFKFLPSLNIKFVDQIDLKNLESESISNKVIASKENLIQIKKDIFLINFNEYFSKKIKRRKQSNKSLNLYSFKISNKVFITSQVKYTWGKKLLSLKKSLEFFSLNTFQQNQTYILQNISLYKTGIFIEKEIFQIQENGKIYNFLKVKKPFLSKIQNQIQNLNDKQTSDQQIKSQKQQNEQFSNSLYFIESKIFFTLKNQRILKFKTNFGIKYYSFQIYKSIFKQPKIIDEDLQKSENLFIYQLADLRSSYIKYYILTDKQVNFEDDKKLKNMINIGKMNFMGKKMQQFTLPINKIILRNEYNELKVKNVRKKVISQANQYFKEKVFQSYQGKDKQNIFLGILQRFHSTQNTDDLNQQYDKFQRQKINKEGSNKQNRISQ